MVFSFNVLYIKKEAMRQDTTFGKIKDNEFLFYGTFKLL